MRPTRNVFEDYFEIVFVIQFVARKNAVILTLRSVLLP